MPRSLLLPLLLSGTLLAHPQATPAPPMPSSTAPAAAPSAAVPAFTAQEVGIDEHLGQTIPLDLTLKGEDGKPVTLRSLVDKPTVLSLNYFGCAGICTPQLGGMAEVFDRTQATPYRDYQVITVSFDPKDTPEVAAQKRTDYLKEINRAFPQEAWRFLTGDPATTKALCDAVGFKFKPQGMDFIHPASLIILSPEGKITRYMYGTTYLPADLQMALEEAAKGQAEPTINKWLSICFSYDPAGRQYVFSFTKVAGLVILLGAAIFVLVVALKKRNRPEPEKEHA